ncbi:hypothetical protein [Thauera phenolivorans]|uniref:hypothetical protein n=1 Tax=Thauera phenolivorans TaxID=1792543 RepID=UPI00083B38B0|nr:hypothetical protein [Thauera phenolivorans]
MNLDPQSLLALHKVNLQFHFRVSELMRDNGLQWAGALRDSLEACNAEIELATTRVLDAGDWKAVGFVAGDAYWSALQHQTRALQRFAETVVATQTGFATALQEAITTWQKEAALALRKGAGAMPLSGLLEALIEPVTDAAAQPAAAGAAPAAVARTPAPAPARRRKPAAPRSR